MNIDYSRLRLHAALTGHREWIGSVAFSPDGAVLATASGDGTAKLWEVGTGRLITTLTEHRKCVRWALFSPDGAVLAISAVDGTVKLWGQGTVGSSPLSPGVGSGLARWRSVLMALCSPLQPQTAP